MLWFLDRIFYLCTFQCKMYAYGFLTLDFVENSDHMRFNSPSVKFSLQLLKTLRYGNANNRINSNKLILKLKI